MFSKDRDRDRDNKDPPPPPIDTRFSLVELRRIHAQLVENKQVTPENQSLVVEILRVLAEMVVYGDRKSELLFDYFCEKNMLQLFLEIMRSEGGCPSAVHVQILQTLSILISSVKNDTSLYYLLSNNHINDVIVFRHENLATDESLAAQYASFIKTLSLRLNEQTVQFFFIEDTGAFPILTKSVEVMKLKDPMVRIAAQTVILNVYKVNENRSRQFALQTEVMEQLFQAISLIMIDQIDQLGSICLAYGKCALEDDAAGMAKVEQSLGDAFIILEDWLYYVQDLLSLKIEVFNRALINYVVDFFVCPVLFKSILHLRPDASEDGFIPLKRMTSLEISTGSESSARKLPPIADNTIDMESIYGCVCLSYLLQMVRIVGSSQFTETVLVGLFHPLNCDTREAMRTAADPAALPFHANQYRSAFAAVLKVESQQRLVLLASFVLYSLFGLFREQRKRELSDTLFINLGEESHVGVVDNSPELADHALAQWLEVLHLVPPGNASPCRDELNALFQLQAWDAKYVRPYLLRIGARRGEDYHYLHVVKMLKQGNLFTLAAVQAAAFSLSLMITVMAPTSTFSLDTAMIDSAHAADLSENAPTLVPDSLAPLCDARITMLKDIREACRSAAQSLLSRLSSSFSEVMLVLINEETKRFSGRQWRLAFQRMSSNKLLFLPATSSQATTLGIDFDMPISQTEAIRKEVQLFLLLRALFKMHTRRKGPTQTEAASLAGEDLSNCVQDQDLLCLEGANLLPSDLIIGAPFEMKGRKFLDAHMTVPAPLQPEAPSSGTSSGGFSSLFSLGWPSGGSSRRQSAPASIPASPSKSATAPPTTPPPPSSAGQASKVKLLFVQDPQYLLLTCQDKSAGKSVFRAHVLAPLLYTDAKVDLLDRRKLKLLVRSWSPMVNMTKLEIEFSDNGGMVDLDVANSITTHSSTLSTALYGDSSSKRMSSAESYLKPCEKSQLWQIVILMDTEQACTLAVQHIESRRKAITAQKVDKLRSVLSNWALDSFDVLADAEANAV